MGGTILNMRAMREMMMIVMAMRMIQCTAALRMVVMTIGRRKEFSNGRVKMTMTMSTMVMILLMALMMIEMTMVMIMC